MCPHPVLQLLGAVVGCCMLMLWLLLTDLAAASRVWLWLLLLLRLLRAAERLPAEAADRGGCWAGSRRPPGKGRRPVAAAPQRVGRGAGGGAGGRWQRRRGGRRRQRRQRWH